MNIQITKSIINNTELNSVNARELYNNLGLAKGQYSRWIQNNLIDQFLYNDDYIGVRQVVEGNEVVSHIVTLDTAKHLCMMAKTENAMKFRKYFIDFEKQHNKPLTTSEQIILLAQGHQEIEQRLSNTEDKINYLENKSPIVYNQIKVLEDKRKSRTNQLVGYNPNCEKSKANYSRTIRALTKKFKDVFGVARYADLPKDKYNDALKWVSSVEMVDLI